MVIEDFDNANVFLDTSPLIYFIEGKSNYQQKLRSLFRRNDEGYFKFCTSTITLLEVMVKPLRDDAPQIVEQYKTILTNAKGLDIFDITVQISYKAAELRAYYNLRTPDSLQIATSIIKGANYFLTNDLRLKIIDEIRVVTLEDLG